MKIICSALVLIFASSQCFAWDGGRFQNLLWQTDLAYKNRCAGDGCDSVWERQKALVKQLIEFINTVPSKERLHIWYGSVASEIATSICSTKRTGVDLQAEELVAQENVLLPLLYSVQRQSGIRDTTYCKISID